MEETRQELKTLSAAALKLFGESRSPGMTFATVAAQTEEEERARCRLLLLPKPEIVTVEVIKEVRVEVPKEVLVEVVTVKEVEVIKEVPVVKEIIKEVEVVREVAVERIVHVPMVQYNVTEGSSSPTRAVSAEAVASDASNSAAAEVLWLDRRQCVCRSNDRGTSSRGHGSRVSPPPPLLTRSSLLQPPPLRPPPPMPPLILPLPLPSLMLVAGLHSAPP